MEIKTFIGIWSGSKGVWVRVGFARDKMCISQKRRKGGVGCVLVMGVLIVDWDVAYIMRVFKILRYHVIVHAQSSKSNMFGDFRGF